MDLKCTLEERQNKQGKKYQCIVIKLTDSCEKLVFLDPAEQELLKVTKLNGGPFNPTTGEVTNDPFADFR